jgi:hypothetical protein
MVTPAGTPAWTRAADHEDYGGHTNKKNYQSLGVINARTDVGAEAITRIAADMAAVARTGAFFSASILCHDGSPDDPTIENALMMTGVRTSSYEGDAPPTGFPGVTRSGTGHVVITFASSYTDAYGVSASFTPRIVALSCGGTTFADATYVISGQTVVVRVFDAAGSALGDKRFSVQVW